MGRKSERDRRETMRIAKRVNAVRKVGSQNIEPGAVQATHLGQNLPGENLRDRSVGPGKIAGVRWEDVGGRPEGIITNEKLTQALAPYATRSHVNKIVRRAR